MTYVLPYILGIKYWEETIDNDEEGVCYLDVTMFDGKKYGQVIVRCPTKGEDRIVVRYYDKVEIDGGEDIEYIVAITEYIDSCIDCEEN